jgi:hypothetical protein
MPHECNECGAAYPAKRAALGYRLCLTCGERAARETRAGWCIAPIAHKQGATLITHKAQLRDLNKVVPSG